MRGTSHAIVNADQFNVTLKPRALKTIKYRGGLVTFDIPSTWVAEYGKDGGGTFYDKGPESGTLRLDVISARRDKPLPSARIAEDLFKVSSPEALPSGFFFRRFTIEAGERGMPLHLHRWEVLVPVSDTDIRLACFTHTLLASQEGSELAARELEIVDAAVRSARFSTAPGINTPKPWWRFWN